LIVLCHVAVRCCVPPDYSTSRLLHFTRGHADIKEVFADLAVLVENQDEQVDAVEENVEQVVKMTEQAGEELMTAERYQKSSRKCTLMLFLIVLVGLITILVQLLKG
jgi:t-SNARE complex subunit (syntaxin)